MDPEEAQRQREAFTQDSAYMIAFDRAQEDERADALFKDPFARRIAGDRGQELAQMFVASGAGSAFKLWPEFHETWTAVRTSFIDGHLKRLLALSTSSYQLVNLGAGFDTRAFRLPCAEKLSASFEIDVIRINELKKNIYAKLEMKALCKQVFVECDLTKEGELKSSLELVGFERKNPSIIIAEGIIMYLGTSQLQFVKELCEITAPGSFLMLNFMDIAAPGILPRADIVDVLEAAGWRNIVVNKFGDSELNYGRFDTEKYELSPGFSFLSADKK